MADPRPAAAPGPDAFFVYGTLRPGQPNFGRVSRLVAEAKPAACSSGSTERRCSEASKPRTVADAARQVGDAAAPT